MASRGRRRLAVAGLLVAAAAGAAGCSGEVGVTVHYGGSPDATLDPVLPTAGAVPTPLLLETTPPAIAEIAALRLRRGGGASVGLGNLRGGRGTVVAFWASYCIPCRDELPALQRLEPALARQGVSLVLADEDEGDATVASFLAHNGLTLGSLVDPGGAVHDALGLIGVPSTALLGADGAVRDRLEGAANLDPLRGALAAMGISAQ